MRTYVFARIRARTLARAEGAVRQPFSFLIMESRIEVNLPHQTPSMGGATVPTPATPEDAAVQAALKAAGPLPEHVAVIMDGNGRWARQHGKDRVFGHRNGVRSVRDLSESCAELGIPYLTLYTFSTENWQRPPREVGALMELLVHTIRKETRTLLDNDIRLYAIGDLGVLPDRCRNELEESMELTRENRRMTLTLALSYSGRNEILRAVRDLADQVARGDLDPADLDEARFEAELYTAGQPDPDLLIRTGGEYRISNFLLWQIAYTELYVTDVPWPEFRRADFYEAIRSFQSRERRFGRVPGEASGRSVQ